MPISCALPRACNRHHGRRTAARLGIALCGLLPAPAAARLARWAAALALACAAPALAAPEQGGPYLVHAQATAPGYTLVLSGGGYDPARVRVLLSWLPVGEDAPAPPPHPLETPALPETPPADALLLEPLRASAQTVMVVLPAKAPPGFGEFRARPPLAVWLRDGERTSAAFAVNLPRAHSLLRDTSRPGELNRIYGFELQATPYRKRLAWLRAADGTRIWALPEVPRHHADGFSEPYHYQFRVPPDVPAGDYDVLLATGAGPRYGYAGPLRLRVVTEPAIPARVWRADAHGVPSDSVTDAQGALQALLDEAGAAGGGTVYLPAGQYPLHRALKLPSRVRLRGAGAGATVLVYAVPAGERAPYAMVSAGAADHSAIEDLTLRGDDRFPILLHYYRGGDPIPGARILNCRFEHGGLEAGGLREAEIGWNTFEDAVLHVGSLDHGWVHHNTVSTGRLGRNPFLVWGARYSTFEHNRVHHSPRGMVWQALGHFGQYRNFIDANEAAAIRLTGNGGETFLFEGAGFRWAGAPVAARADGLRLPPGTLESGKAQDAFAVVVRGRGAGQYRRIASHTDADVTLADPWAVLPAGEVRIAILQGTVENVFTNNREAQADNSVMFYGAGAIANRIVRNRSDDGLGITMWSLAEAAKNVLVPDYFNLFDSNVLEDQGTFWLTTLGDSQPSDQGIRNRANVYRSNLVSDPRRKRENQYWNVWDHARSFDPVRPAFWLAPSYPPEPQGPVWQDVLIEHNHIVRAAVGIQIQPTAAGAVVRRNAICDTARPVIAHGLGALIADDSACPVR